MRLERLVGAQVRGGRAGDAYLRVEAMAHGRGAMIGVKTVVGGVPLEKREALGPRKISRAWQLPVGIRWRSKPGRAC